MKHKKSRKCEIYISKKNQNDLSMSLIRTRSFSADWTSKSVEVGLTCFILLVAKLHLQ